MSVLRIAMNVTEAIEPGTTIDFTRILGEVRRRSPRTIRSALKALDEVVGEMFGVDCCALVIPRERTVYVTRPIPGVSEEAIYEAIRTPRGSGYRRVMLAGDRRRRGDESGTAVPALYTVPLFSGRERAAVCSMITRRAERFEQFTDESFERFIETLSSIFQPYLGGACTIGGQRGRRLRSEILESVGDELMMRNALLRIMELSRAEFCAFYTEEPDDCFSIMLECAELSPRIPEIREKLRRTYRMFARSRDEARVLQEHVFVKSRERRLAYLLGGVKIESYFIVPVTFDARVRGVLFIGSVLKDAFAREDIAAFQELADDEGERVPLRYSVGGETGILERMVNALPFGGALVAPGGALVHANEEFRDVLEIRGRQPDTIEAIPAVSPYNLHGLWEEFRILEHDIVGRELQSGIGHERTVAVTWVRLGNLSSEVESLMLIDDITGERKREEEREEMLATVAHELRTPMTALKNALAIIREGVAAEGTRTGGGDRAALSRFLETALRTVGRLNMLVDGIVEVSTFRLPDHTLRTAPVDVERFIEDSSYLFAESMRKRGIAFEVRVDPDTGVLNFDRDRMEQVVQNLLSNSMKHVPSGGAISIDVFHAGEAPPGLFPRIPWEHLWRPAFACIRVRDTGSGIPARVAADINRQNRSAGERVRPSHGLGLYIATRLVRRHGGALSIENTGESGSAVSIYLPVRVETGRVVRTVRAIEGLLADAEARGLTPVLYSIVRRGTRPWRKIAESMHTSTVVNPTRDAIENGGCYLWPLGRHYAAVVVMTDRGGGAADGEYALNGEQMLFVAGERPADIDVGWAVAPRDGRTYGELVTASIDRIGVEPVAIAQKGENG